MMKSTSTAPPPLLAIRAVEPASRGMTSYSGLRVVAELLERVGVRAIVDRTITVKRRKRGYSDADFVFALAMNQLLGGRALDDLHTLRDDATLCELLGMRVPAATTAGDYLRNVTPGHIRQCEAMQREALAAAHRGAIDPFVPVATIEADATYAQVYGHQQGADRLHTREVGFHPHFAFRAETGECLHAKLRRGHASAAGNSQEALAFVQHAFDALPCKPQEKRFRGDAAYYKKSLLRWFEQNDIRFAVTAMMSPGLRAHIVALDDSAWSSEPGGKPDPGGTKRRPHPPMHAPEIAEFPWTLRFEDGEQMTVRIVVRRRRIATPQRALYADDDGAKYHASATNRTNLRAHLVLEWADERGNAENCVRELKGDLDACGCGLYQFHANAFAMHAAVLAYNAICWLRLVAHASAAGTTGAPRDAARWQTRTWRRELFAVPGYLVRRSRQFVLKVTTSSTTLALFRDLAAAFVDTWG